MSKNILYITTRNILSTSGELRLIKNRTNVLYEKWDINTDFIAIADQRKITHSNESIDKASSMKTISFNKQNPWTFFKAIKNTEEIILEKLRKKTYGCIILSGALTYPFYSLVRKISSNIPVIADIHGAKEELIEFKTNKILKNIYRRILFEYIRFNEKKYLPQFDGSLIVSEALGHYLDNQYNLQHQQYYVVPCANEEVTINKKYYQENRQKYRKKYGVKSEDLLFIYSGGVSPWQCIEESIEIFNEFRKNESKINSKMLILSHHIEKIGDMVKDHENIIIDKVNAAEVENVLTAGDYAFLLRGDYVTNNVAYPNKFLEYVYSGMKIITTPHVYDIAKQVKEYQLGLIINSQKDYLNNLFEYIKNDTISDNRQFESREKLLYETSFEKTLEKFVFNFFNI